MDIVLNVLSKQFYLVFDSPAVFTAGLIGLIVILHKLCTCWLNHSTAHFQYEGSRDTCWQYGEMEGNKNDASSRHPDGMVSAGIALVFRGFQIWLTKAELLLTKQEKEQEIALLYQTPGSFSHGFAYAIVQLNTHDNNPAELFSKTEHLYADLWHLYLPDGEIPDLWARGRALAFGCARHAAAAHQAFHIRTLEMTIKHTQA